MLLTRLYWRHYSILFVGHYVVLLVMLLGDAVRAGPRLATVILALSLAASVSAGYRAARMTVDLLERPVSARSAAIVGYMWTESIKGRDFLVVFDMKPHWLLRQSRHGFPHAANAGHIHKGWWNEAPEVTHIFAPKTDAAYCARLLSAGPEFVFEQRDGGPIPCLTSDASAYRLDRILGGTHIMVFRR